MMWKNNKILITGANGFIGMHLTERLIKEGACVSAFIEPGLQLRYIDWNDVKHYEVDITDKDAVLKSINEIRPNTVFHLAAITNNDFSLENIKGTFEVNFLGTANILEALKHIDCRCFVSLSTGEIYGHNIVPFSETQRLNPILPYSISKAATEMLCTMYHNIFKYPVVIIRPSVVYGPMQSETMLIPQLILAMLRKKKLKMTKGEQTRDFIYVSDVVNGIIKASVNETAECEIYNLALGKSFAVIDVVRKIISLLDNYNKVIVGGLEYRPDEIWESSFNIDKAISLLKWKPKIDLESGLKITVNWYKEEFEKGRLT